jgi:hypothetical protein
MPDNVVARTFVTIVSAEPGVKSIEITPMISLDEMLADLGNAKATKSASGYTAPGR